MMLNKRIDRRVTDRLDKVKQRASAVPLKQNVSGHEVEVSLDGICVEVQFDAAGVRVIDLPASLQGQPVHVEPMSVPNLPAPSEVGKKVSGLRLSTVNRDAWTPKQIQLRADADDFDEPCFPCTQKFRVYTGKAPASTSIGGSIAGGSPTLRERVTEVADAVSGEAVPSGIPQAGEDGLLDPSWIPWASMLATSGTFQWLARAAQIAAQDPPSALSWSYAIKCWTPCPIDIHGFGYGLLSPGTKDMGPMRCSVWANGQVAGVDWPVAEYEATRVFCLHGGRPAGPVIVPLQSRGVSAVRIAAGYFWIIPNISNDLSHTEIKPDIEWLSSPAMGKAFSHALATGSFGAFLTPPWDYANDVPQEQVPNVWVW